MQIYKYLTISSSTHNNLVVLRTLTEQNTPPHKITVTYMCVQDLNVS